MATAANGRADQAVVACEVCMKEIPISEAQSEEADDYVRHFCGLECYARWRAQKEDKQQGVAD